MPRVAGFLCILVVGCGPPAERCQSAWPASVQVVGIDAENSKPFLEGLPATTARVGGWPAECPVRAVIGTSERTGETVLGEWTTTDQGSGPSFPRLPAGTMRVALEGDGWTVAQTVITAAKATTASMRSVRTGCLRPQVVGDGTVVCGWLANLSDGGLEEHAGLWIGDAFLDVGPAALHAGRGGLFSTVEGDEVSLWYLDGGVPVTNRVVAAGFTPSELALHSSGGTVLSSNDRAVIVGPGLTDQPIAIDLPRPSNAQLRRYVGSSGNEIAVMVGDAFTRVRFCLVRRDGSQPSQECESRSGVMAGFDGRRAWLLRPNAIAVFDFETRTEVASAEIPADLWLSCPASLRGAHCSSPSIVRRDGTRDVVIAPVLDTASDTISLVGFSAPGSVATAGDGTALRYWTSSLLGEEPVTDAFLSP